MEFPFLTIHYLVNVGLQLLTFTAKSLIMTFLVLLLSSSLLPLQILFLFNSEPSVSVAHRLEQLQSVSTDQKWKNKFTEKDNAATPGRGGTWTGISIIPLCLPLLWTGIVWRCFCRHVHLDSQKCRILNPASLCLVREDGKAAGICPAGKHPKQTWWAAMGICSHSWLLCVLDTNWASLQREGSPSEEDPLWPSCRLPWTWFTEKRGNFFLCIKEVFPLHLSRHCSQRGWKGKWIVVLEGMTAALANPLAQLEMLVYNRICPVWVKVQCWWFWCKSRGCSCPWVHINWGQTPSGHFPGCHSHWGCFSFSAEFSRHLMRHLLLN